MIVLPDEYDDEKIRDRGTYYVHQEGTYLRL
jgi:hypothetical protein